MRKKWMMIYFRPLLSWGSSIWWTSDSLHCVPCSMLQIELCLPAGWIFLCICSWIVLQMAEPAASGCFPHSCLTTQNKTTGSLGCCFLCASCMSVSASDEWSQLSGMRVCVSYGLLDIDGWNYKCWTARKRNIIWKHKILIGWKW